MQQIKNMKRNLRIPLNNLNLFYIFQKDLSVPRDRYIWKKNLVSTNWYSSSEVTLFTDVPRTFNILNIEYLWRFLRYFVKGFSPARDVFIYAEAPSTFTLIKYYSWKFGCSYALGWYPGLKANSYYIASYLHRRGFQYFFLLPKSIDFFVSVDSNTVFSNKVRHELNALGCFTFSFNNCADNSTFDYCFFTSKFLYQLYYYLEILLSMLYSGERLLQYEKKNYGFAKRKKKRNKKKRVSI